MTFIESCTIAVNLELIHDLWVPNIFIYNLKTFQVIDVLSKLAGLWINNKKEVYYRFVSIFMSMMTMGFMMGSLAAFIRVPVLLAAKPRTSPSSVPCSSTRSRWIRKSASSR